MQFFDLVEIESFGLVPLIWATFYAEYVLLSFSCPRFPSYQQRPVLLWFQPTLYVGRPWISGISNYFPLKNRVIAPIGGFYQNHHSQVSLLIFPATPIECYHPESLAESIEMIARLQPIVAMTVIVPLPQSNLERFECVGRPNPDCQYCLIEIG